MPVDFTPTDDQRRLRARAREFARDVLARVADECLALPTPEARFRATRDHYEALIAAGFLERLVPMPFGGGGTGSVDMAIVAEEFHAVDVNVSLTMFANLLGLMPVFVAGTDAQRSRLVAPFLETRGAPLAALANSEPGGSANYDAPPPADGVRTTAELMRVVGIDSYDHGLSPLGRLAQDALVLPLFDGGNNGVRRRQLHAILASEAYVPLSTTA